LAGPDGRRFDAPNFCCMMLGMHAANGVAPIAAQSATGTARLPGGSPNPSTPNPWRPETTLALCRTGSLPPRGRLPRRGPSSEAQLGENAPRQQLPGPHALRNLNFS